MRQIFFFISLAVLGFGLYLKFFYDVPDSQEAINFFVSGFLIIVGLSSMLINLFWGKAKNSKDNHE
jgi:hypothetical protein